jgi:hypothetical protein
MSLTGRSALAALALAVVAAACGGKQPEKKMAPAPGVEAAAPAADAIGVPECDTYIQKYEACIDAKVPEVARASVKSAFDQVRASWKTAAATPEGKAGLAAVCTQAMDTAKQSMGAYGCEW